MGVPTARCGNVSTNEKNTSAAGCLKAALLADYRQRNLKLPTLHWQKGVKKKKKKTIPAEGHVFCTQPRNDWKDREGWMFL